MYAEIKRNGEWHLLGVMEDNIDYVPEDNPNAQRRRPIELYENRDYNLFDILALDGERFEVIAPKRGLPNDLGSELLNWVKDWDDGVQNPSWLLLSEIMQFDWNGKFMSYQAMVDPRVAHLFKEGKPFPYAEWPKDVQMGYAGYMKGGVMVQWTDTYAASVGRNFFDLVNNLAEHGDPSEIRLVFWFEY
jgi:hypothetical protein